MKKYNIVITGGSCSGKSSSLPFLKNKLEQLGFAVVISSETGTDLFLSGITPFNVPWSVFQSIIVERAIVKEQTIKSAVKLMNCPVVVLYDRALFDNKVYLDNDSEFDNILEKAGLVEEEVWNNYDAIFHLTTTANGAEEHFTQENNEARFETVSTAKIYEEKVKQVWSSHQYFRVIENYPTFDEKLHKLFHEIETFIKNNS